MKEMKRGKSTKNVRKNAFRAEYLEKIFILAYIQEKKGCNYSSFCQYIIGEERTNRGSYFLAFSEM